MLENKKEKRVVILLRGCLKKKEFMVEK